MSRLASLEYLNLASNQLSDLPAELAALRKLRFAALGNNRFTSVPEVVTQWSQLEVLELAGNDSFSLSMDEYDDLDIDRGASRTENAALADLHPGLRELADLRVLLLDGNPRLGLPAELLGEIEQGFLPTEGSVPEILEYYFRTRGRSRPLNEAKVILLGRGDVGKTSLVNRLVHDRFDPTEDAPRASTSPPGG